MRSHPGDSPQLFAATRRQHFAWLHLRKHSARHHVPLDQQRPSGHQPLSTTARRKDCHRARPGKCSSSAEDLSKAKHEASRFARKVVYLAFSCRGSQPILRGHRRAPGADSTVKAVLAHCERRDDPLEWPRQSILAIGSSPRLLSQHHLLRTEEIALTVTGSQSRPEAKLPVQLVLLFALASMQQRPSRQQVGPQLRWQELPCLCVLVQDVGSPEVAKQNVP